MHSALAPNFLVLEWTSFLHGMAASTGHFQLSPRIFWRVLVFFVIWIIKVDSSQSSSIVQFWLLVFSILVFLDSGLLYQFFSSFRPNMIWTGSRLNFCQSSHWPHISLGRFFFQNSESCESFPGIWQTSVQIDIPVVINMLFLHDVQISTNGPGSINVFQWNGECFFLRHVELNSRFIVMTTDEVTLNPPEVGTGFSVIFWFCRLRISQFAFKFSTLVASVVLV